MKKLSLTIILLLIIPSLAYSHVSLTEMTPGKDTVLSEQPGKITLKFNGLLEHAISKIEVYDQQGNKVSKDTQLTDIKHFSIMEVELANGLNDGEYTVKWKCMSKDGHGQMGGYKFSIK
jgi:methionine-rich copper-binding protein CopC